MFLFLAIGSKRLIPEIPVESVISLSFFMMEIVISWAIPPFPEPMTLSIRGKYIISEMPKDIVGGHPRPKDKNSKRVSRQNVSPSNEYSCSDECLYGMKRKSSPRRRIMGEVMYTMNITHHPRMMEPSMCPIKIRIMVDDEESDAQEKISCRVFSQ